MLLQITISYATELKPTNASVLPHHKELCIAFAEMRVYGKIHTTPVAPQGNSPHWGWTVCVPLFKDPVATDTQLDFTLCNMATDDQPASIGSASFSLNTLTQDDISGTEPRCFSLRLKPPKGMKGGGGRLHLKILWDQDLKGRAGLDEARRRDGPLETTRLARVRSRSVLLFSNINKKRNDFF